MDWEGFGLPKFGALILLDVLEAPDMAPMELCKNEGDGSPAGVNDAVDEGGGGPMGVVDGWSAEKPKPDEAFREPLSGVEGDEFKPANRNAILTDVKLDSYFEMPLE